MWKKEQGLQNCKDIKDVKKPTIYGRSVGF